MSPAGSSNAPEARARQRIDQALTDAGWTLQDRDDMNLAAASSAFVNEIWPPCDTEIWPPCG